MQCLRMKADSFVTARKEQEADAYSLASSTSVYHEASDNLRLDKSEMDTLMTGIGNMLIKLRRTLCEMVDSWNTR